MIRPVQASFAVATLTISLFSQKGAPATVEPPAGLSLSTDFYRFEWKRHFDLRIGIVPVGVADDSGTLWLMARSAPLKRDLIKIDSKGELVGRYETSVPLRSDEFISDLSPAASGDSVGLLASLASGGRAQTFEGAYFVPVQASGLGTPVRIAGRGPQFPDLIGTGQGQFITAGDQEPLTLIKLDATGHVIWKRSFSRRLVLPAVNVTANGEVLVLSQGGNFVQLQVLDPAGKVLRSKRISGRQGTIAADRIGYCSILFSERIGGTDNHVKLLTLDPELRQIHQAETPIRGIGGRTYQLVSTPGGHLVIGQGPNQNQNTVADFDSMGRLRWQRVLQGGTVPLLVAFPSGVYVVHDASGGGTEVEKYLYR